MVTTAGAEPEARAYPGQLGRAVAAARHPPRRGRRARRAARPARPTSSTRRACPAAPRPARPPRGARYVVKLTADEAFERARRGGAASTATSKPSRGGRRTCGSAPSAGARTAALRRARTSSVPSAYLRERRARLGARPRADVGAPEPLPALPALATRDELRATLGLERADARLRRAADARRRRSASPSTRSSVSGVSRCSSPATGPTAQSLERESARRGLDGRVPLPRAAAARRGAATSSARPTRALLSSAWENFPHARRRGARSRYPRHRNARRRSARGRAGRRQRPAGSARRPGGSCGRQSSASASDGPLRARLAAAGRGLGQPTSRLARLREIERVLAEVVRG